MQQNAPNQNTSRQAVTTRTSQSTSYSNSSRATTSAPIRSFQLDLAESNGPVSEAKKRLEELGYVVEENEATTIEGLRKCDLTAYLPLKRWEKFLIEVKYDKKWKETGNVALEHKALLHSSSEYIFYKLKGIKGLRRLTRDDAIKILQSDRYRQVPGGDFKDLLTLIPWRQFIELTEPL